MRKHKTQSYRFRSFRTRVKEMPPACKIAAVIAAIVFIRAGSSYPLPFVNADYMKALLSIQGLAFLNSITGGSMQQMSFFALSISPYITASIIMQLLTAVIPALEDLQKDGKTGMERYKNITRLVAISLSIIQSVSMAVGLGARGLLVSYTPLTVAFVSIMWSVGAIVLIGISVFIDWLEIGSGVSILLCANILSGLPSDAFTVWTVLVSGKPTAWAVLSAVLACAAVIAVLAACAVLATARKEIPVTDSRKMAGHLSKSTFPIPLNTCSVMPVIFAGSIMSIPVIAAQFAGISDNSIVTHITRCLSPNEWFRPAQPVYTVGAVLYFAFTTIFTYFYLDIGFNPYEIADNLKRSGAAIPGIRPGTPTAEYMKKTSTRVALVGNTATTLLILAMYAVCNACGIGTLGIAGTSAVILVGVVAEEMRLFESMRAAGRAVAYRSRKPKTVRVPGRRVVRNAEMG